MDRVQLNRNFRDWVLLHMTCTDVDGASKLVYINTELLAPPDNGVMPEPVN